MPHTTPAYIARHPADRHHHHESQTNAQTRAPLSRRWPGTGETNDDPLENLRVDVHDPYILVSLRGTCFRAKYRRQDAPWLATDEYGPEDPEATITSNEFRTLAWAAANEEARQLGWIRSFDELHKAVAASAIGVRANARLANARLYDSEI
jgi:hypothetical protein